MLFSVKNQGEKSCLTDFTPMDIPNKMQPKDVLTIKYSYSVNFTVSI